MLFAVYVWSVVCSLLWLVAVVEMILTRGPGVIGRDIFLGSMVLWVILTIIGVGKECWPWVKRNASKLWVGVCWLAIFGGLYYAHTVAQADLERQHQVEIENMRHDMYVNNEVTR